jgi:aldehyde:ferredoxin oxidoreductase
MGASESWVNVFIDDDRGSVPGCHSSLGLGTFETEEAIREALGDDQVRSATIGPRVRMECALRM